MNDAAPKMKPSHHVSVVEDGKDGKGHFTRVGSAWPTKDGKGFSILLKPGIAVSGRIVLYPPKPEDEVQD